mmetsp:Transcript_103685/g.237424  ORF Transcript_103685/g.237424 Transcript_103685/m.237424 type:complete len:85 (+) Transcript_103685:313-567(+)
MVLYIETQITQDRVSRTCLALLVQICGSTLPGVVSMLGNSMPAKEAPLSSACIKKSHGIVRMPEKSRRSAPQYGELWVVGGLSI